MRRIGRSRVISVLAAVSLAAVAAACGSSGAGGGDTGGGGKATSLTISNESGSTWTCVFNPLNPNDTGLSFGTVYEELVFVNALRSAAETPWLAKSWTWSNGNKTLTFTMRSGVKWSDGKPFTAKDVLFTFNLLKKYPALDLASVWSVLSGVSMGGPNQVVFNLKTSAVPYFYYIADQTPIVPEHIWSRIKNPVNYADTKPVGTGPYTVSRCTPENITYTKNPDYWQPGLPKIQTVNYPSFTSNDPANQLLANGQAQWGSQFIPSIKAYYLSKSPNFHTWFPPVANVGIFINLSNPVLSQLPVRKAMAYAIDRAKVSQIGEYGYEPPSNQTSIVKPTFSSWVDTTAANSYNYTYNPARAKAILSQAGYTEKNGIWQTPKGPLSFTIINEGGYSDWVASVSVIVGDLAAVGIQVTPQNLADTTYSTDAANGKFQLAYDAETGGPSPYYELRQMLYSKNSAPIGQPASTNWERYSNPKTDALINDYAATTSSAVQHQIVNKLEGVMLSDVPVIPTTEQVDWYEYDTTNIKGWPTPQSPYAQPAAFDYPDWGVLLLHLSPK